jgi:hypothetical protein
MSASHPIEGLDPLDCVVHAQAPIEVYTDESDAVVVKQFDWRDGYIVISFRPEHVFALCRALLEEAGVDADSALREGSPKDPTAAERQRRRRERMRNSHDQVTASVTAELENVVDSSHQEGGPATVG